MANIEIDVIVKKFQDEIGRLSGQVLINQAQVEANQQEFLQALASKDERIAQLQALVDEAGLDSSAITAGDPITSVEQANQVAERLAEPTLPDPVRPAAKKTPPGRRR